MTLYLLHLIEVILLRRQLQLIVFLGFGLSFSDISQHSDDVLDTRQLIAQAVHFGLQRVGGIQANVTGDLCDNGAKIFQLVTMGGQRLLTNLKNKRLLIKSAHTHKEEVL